MEDTNANNATGNQCDSKSPNSWSTTAMDEETFTHRWTVQTFRNIWETLEQGGRLNSADFPGLTTNNLWHMSLQKNTQENVEYLGVFLGFTSRELKRKRREDGETLMAKAKFSILDEKNHSVLDKEAYFRHFLTDIDPCENWGFLTFLKADDLLDTTKGFIVADQLRIDCRVTVLKRVNSYISVPNKRKTTDSTRSMSQDYQKMLESADYHDVIINSGTQQFKAHKVILSARSSVFSAMFKTEMTESITGKMTITDFPDHIIKEMLQFLYCGKMENKNENILELLKIADKYNITDLVDECCAIIPSILTSDNALETLMAIPAYNPGDLKFKVINFVALNKATVMKTPTFQNMVYIDPGLFKELMIALV